MRNNGSQLCEAVNICTSDRFEFAGLPLIGGHLMKEIKKANNSSQLYLLVPSNYPVLVAVGNEREKAAAAAVAASAVNEPTTRSLLERFQLNSTSNPPPVPPQQPSPTVVQSGQLDGQRQISAGASASLPRPPRKNSTNIPPMILQSLKGVVPPINFRAAGNGSTGSSANLSSLALAYGAGDLPTAGSGDHSSLPVDRKKSLSVPPDAASSFLEEFRAAAAAAAAVGEVKIKPPPPSSSGAGSTTGGSGPDSGLCPPDGLLGTDSNGNREFIYLTSIYLGLFALSNLCTSVHYLASNIPKHWMLRKVKK
ncbi:unnamed protein product [Hymenolepis diminuta]|uniref:Uncharacterized protein n=1 Tax=Hymenolepis diminuta TaxID=6216 RepID=A0A0R3SKJ6_HYMDI|nr:unnamed protein product [Hymenolepis diminuta]